MPTNDYSKNIVYLSKEQYQELITNETLTVNSQTITYNDNDIYVTPQAEPITDVRINGTSIGSNGVANIPVAKNSTLGVIKIGATDGWYGISTDTSGTIFTSKATSTQIKNGTETYKPIVSSNQHEAIFYGLAKAAGHDEKDSTESLGTYTPGAKQAIQNMLGVTDLISTEEVSTATAAHALNSTFMMNGKLHRATAAIAIGDAVEVGTNCEVVKADEVFLHDVQVNGTSIVSNGVANIPKAGSGSGGTLGVVTSNSSYGTTINSGGAVIIAKATDADMKTGIGQYRPVTPYTQHMSVFYGLSKVAGIDLKDETVTLGTYPETSKTAIRSLIGAAAASDIPSVPVQDVQVNGTSVLSNGVANVPIGSSSTFGVFKRGSGLYDSNGTLGVNSATDTDVKNGTVGAFATVSRQHISTFYGLAKAAGVDEKNSTLSVGTYTETAKTAIRNMLGAASPDVVAISDTQPTNTDTKVWLPETQAVGVQVPTMEDLGDYVQKTDYATTSNYGVIKVGAGLTKDGNNALVTDYASDDVIKSGSGNRRPITPSYQYKSVFYGLAKAAGDTTQSQSSNAVGTYTADASAAIRSMIGAVGDVQVNGTSVVSSGVANIPVASNTTFGTVKVGLGLFTITTTNSSYYQMLCISKATDNDCKIGTESYTPIVPYNQHRATFYGLAKAAGDSTQSASSNAVGTYTDSAKASIKSMLGIVDGSTGTVDITGTTPSITAVENTRYVCGEVSTLSFTPAASGICIVRFTSGSTATVLTVPNTVKFPEWFDITALEADTIYEICITDGVYGAVMSWAL